MKPTTPRTEPATSTRRSFLKQAAAVATLSPFILPSRIHAAETGPNSLVNMAFIGMGLQGRILLGNFLGQNIKVVAVCDVDTTRREHALKIVQEFHTGNPGKGAFGCKSYADFREIIARKDIDAVCIATPDHWHALITLAALESGKDVYCEKPLTHNIHEAIEVMAAVKRHQRVLQTGSMQRSMSEFRIACELVRNGVIGKLERVTCKVGDPSRPCDLPEEPMEPGLDWDRWVGPAPMRPYNSALCPRGVFDSYPAWRSYVEFGGGAVCDFGAHHFDIAQWGLGMDESGPVEVRPPAKADALSGAVMVYANGVTVTQTGGGNGMRFGGLRFYGTDGEVEVDRGSFELVRGKETMIQAARAEKEYLTDAKIRLYHSKSHYADFLERVADRKRPVASEVVGAHTAICCHLINLAYAHRKTIKWDPAKLAFTDPSCDAGWLTRNYRAPWKA
jgi:predicted dehydrogenase